jgi:hypothetical protein
MAMEAEAYRGKSWRLLEGTEDESTVVVFGRFVSSGSFFTLISRCGDDLRTSVMALSEGHDRKGSPTKRGKDVLFRLRAIAFVYLLFGILIVYHHGLDNIHMYPFSTAASLFNMEEPVAPMTAITH